LKREHFIEQICISRSQSTVNSIIRNKNTC